jgi:carbonic anhydrase
VSDIDTMEEYNEILIWILSPEVSVKEDVEILRASPFFKGMQLLGFVQDTETGLLSQIVGLE